MYDLVNSGVEQRANLCGADLSSLCMTSLIVGSNSQDRGQSPGYPAVYDLVNSGVEQRRSRSVMMDLSLCMTSLIVGSSSEAESGLSVGVLCMTSLIVGSNSDSTYTKAENSAVYDLVNSGVEQLHSISEVL